MKNHLAKYYKKMGDTPPWEESTDCSRPRCRSPIRGSVGHMTIGFSHPEFHASVAEVCHAATSIAEARAGAFGGVSVLLDGGGGRRSEFAEAWSDWLRASASLRPPRAGGSPGGVQGRHHDLDARSASALDVLTRRLS